MKGFHLKANTKDVHRLETIMKKSGMTAYADTIRYCIKKTFDGLGANDA